METEKVTFVNTKTEILSNYILCFTIILRLNNFINTRKTSVKEKNIHLPASSIFFAGSDAILLTDAVYAYVILVEKWLCSA